MGVTAGCLPVSVLEEEPQSPRPEEEERQPEEPKVDLEEFEDLALDMDAWSYDEDHDCYYQLAVPYCLTPGSEQYESLSIFVPGAYLTGTDKGAPTPARCPRRAGRSVHAGHGSRRPCPSTPELQRPGVPHHLLV